MFNIGLGIRLGPELEEKLQSLARETGAARAITPARPSGNISKIARII
jgi:predicted transcriptional regulator